MTLHPLVKLPTTPSNNPKQLLWKKKKECKELVIVCVRVCRRKKKGVNAGPNAAAFAATG